MAAGSRIGILRGLPGFAAANRLRQYLFNRNFRETERLRAAWPIGLFQPSGHTKYDRHPDLFALARTLVGDSADHRMLSFGCATGEEVFTLARYFTAARIDGIDISAARIRQAERAAGRSGDPRLRFLQGASAPAVHDEGYHAIFALSVFRHGDLNHSPERCDDRVRFADFDRTITGLAAAVRPGGLLVIRHASFRFGDTQAARSFECIARRERMGLAPFYDSDNRLLPDQPVDEEVVFRRIA